MPALLDAAWCYDENGVSVQEEVKIRIQERKEYVDFVQKTEESKGLSPLLSAVLGDMAGNDFPAAMNLYGEGQFAEYCKIMDVYHERWVGGFGRPDISAAADT